MRRIVFCGAAALLGLFALPIGAASAANSTLTSYGADAAATGVHILSYTNGLTNFATGFLDNSYPLANTHMDAGPATQAVATIGDTGPLGATGQGVANDPCSVLASAGASGTCYAAVTGSPVPPPPVEQPQYAVARYPGSPAASASQAGTVAEATADDTSAVAHAAFVAGSGGDARSSVKLDPVTGVVTGASESHINRVVFSEGLLDIRGVDVHATVRIDNGKVTPHYDINVASATVNGTPVKITDKGVVVQDAPLPGSDAMTAVVNEQLNGALASSGFSVFVTPPKVAVAAGQATVEVSALHVHYTAPNPDPSVPTFTADYILGEARAFGFAAGAGADLLGGSVDNTTLPDITTVEGASDLGDVSGAVTELPAQTGAAALQATTPSRTLRAAPAAYRRERPTWLVPIYIIWQILVLATGAALLWSRRAEA